MTYDYLPDLIDWFGEFDCGRSRIGCWNEDMFHENCSEKCLKKALINHDIVIRADAIRKFAEWLVNRGVLGNRVIANGEITDYGKFYVSEYEKEQK